MTRTLKFDRKLDILYKDLENLIASKLDVFTFYYELSKNKLISFFMMGNEYIRRSGAIKISLLVLM